MADKDTWRGVKSNKILKSAQKAPLLMKKANEAAWAAISRGEQLVLGDGPRELIKSMGLHYQCHAWWSSVFAAKQLDRYYHGVMEKKGFFRSLQGDYESITLGYALDQNPEIAPYGGMRKPIAWTIDRAESARVYELYAREFDCPLYFMNFASPSNVPTRWWESEDWGEPHFVDQWTREFEGCARFLEAVTGKTYSDSKLRALLEIADKTCEYYSKATDLACDTIPAPISVTDAFSEVSVYNWFQGEPWALEHAKQYYEEIKERVDNKKAVCDEKVRLLWMATLPIWFSLGFYNSWEQSHGAVFLARNYISMAQRIVYHDRSNPLKAIALRRHLRYGAMTPAALSNYALYEIEKCKADGAIIPVTKGGARGELFLYETLKRKGIPAIMIPYDPVSCKDWNDDEMRGMVTRFIEEITPKR